MTEEDVIEYINDSGLKKNDIGYVTDVKDSINGWTSVNALIVDPYKCIFREGIFGNDYTNIEITKEENQTFIKQQIIKLELLQNGS